MPACRSKMCCAYRMEPVVKRPRKVHTEVEKEETKAKHGEQESERKPHPKAFSLTENEILTLPHESILGSPKTYFALADAKALQRCKLAAGTLLETGVKDGYLRVLRSETDEGRRKKANFWCIHEGDARLYERRLGNNVVA
ncbi:hypothetical protein C8R44DRAFT_745672 [Mycena epipterygia]|nr:hypothetical protein C8R44DRAFT_745672 [Mycena epipterygia]